MTSQFHLGWRNQTHKSFIQNAKTNLDLGSEHELKNTLFGVTILWQKMKSALLEFKIYGTQPNISFNPCMEENEI